MKIFFVLLTVCVAASYATNIQQRELEVEASKRQLFNWIAPYVANLSQNYQSEWSNSVNYI